MDPDTGTNDDGSERPDSAGSVPASKGLDAPQDKPATQSQLAKVEKEMSGFERAVLRWTIATFVVYVVTAIFVGLQWHVLKGQLGVMQGQLNESGDELLRSHRPWVGIVDPIKVTKPPEFTTTILPAFGPNQKPRVAHGAEVGIEFTTRNSGSSPAIRQQQTVSFWIDPPPDQMQVRCDPAVGDAGGFLLPGAEQTTKMSIPAIPSDKHPPPGLHTGIYLMVCITYADEFGRPHATGLKWGFQTNDPNMRNFMENKSGSVKGEFIPFGAESVAR